MQKEFKYHKKGPGQSKIAITCSHMKFIGVSAGEYSIAQTHDTPMLPNPGSMTQTFLAIAPSIAPSSVSPFAVSHRSERSSSIAPVIILTLGKAF